MNACSISGFHHSDIVVYCTSLVTAHNIKDNANTNNNMSAAHAIRTAVQKNATAESIARLKIQIQLE